MANKVEDIKKQKDGLDVLPDLLRYSKTGYESVDPDDMLRFRWYGIYEQQPKAGHFMMRVKIPGGDVRSDQWRVMGEIARDFGGGIADITTRQNIQFHWLTLETIPTVLERMGSVGLSTVGACGDITRNITGNPLAGLDPDELYDTRPLIQEINTYFLGNKEFSDLPRKYKMAISGGVRNCHQPEINDVSFTAVQRRNNGALEVGFDVRVGGGLSTQPHIAQRLNVFITPEQLPEVCYAVTKIYRDDGYRSRRNHSRLKFLVADWGAEKFLDRLVEILGWRPDPFVEIENTNQIQRDYVGVFPQKQPGLHYIGVAVLTGRLTAEQMIAAADISEKYCDGVLRTTNQQNLIFPNVNAEHLESAKEAISAAGFRFDVSRFRRASVACTGTEFCNLAVTETKNRLKEIVGYLEDRLEWKEDIRINLNGCPNACGQHYVADIGLQGCLARVGEEKVEAYDICLGGRLGEDAKFTRPIQRKVPATKVKFAIENLLNSYRDTRLPDENFSRFVDRHSDEALGVALGLHLLADADPDYVPPPPRHASAGID